MEEESGSSSSENYSPIADPAGLKQKKGTKMGGTRAGRKFMPDRHLPYNNVLPKKRHGNVSLAKGDSSLTELAFDGFVMQCEGLAVLSTISNC